MNILIDATRRLNDRLSRLLGPAEIAPIDPHAQRAPATKPCPLCGAPIAEHRIEESDGHTYLHHPDGRRSDVMETGR